MTFSIEDYVPAQDMVLVKPILKPDELDGFVGINDGSKEESFFEVIKIETERFANTYASVLRTPNYKEFAEGKYGTIHVRDIDGFFKK